MSQVITAVYSQGVLRPRVPLVLLEEQEVEIEIRPARAAVAERRQLIAELSAAGLLANQPADFPLPPAPISEAEELELAELFAGEPPLSELIIEERQQGW